MERQTHGMMVHHQCTAFRMERLVRQELLDLNDSDPEISPNQLDSINRRHGFVRMNINRGLLYYSALAAGSVESLAFSVAASAWVCSSSDTSPILPCPGITSLAF